MEGLGLDPGKLAPIRPGGNTCEGIMETCLTKTVGENLAIYMSYSPNSFKGVI